MMRLDHVVVSAARLEDGAAWVETALGAEMAGGGRHPLMGTHNRLLGLGDSYLEVIAADPEAGALPHARWFDLDRFTGPPRPTNWVLRCDDLDAALALLPQAGWPLDLSRGDLRWRMAVPEDGLLPFDNLFPALIQWQGAAPSMADSGLRLRRVEIRHPQAAELAGLLGPLVHDARLAFLAAERPALRLVLTTPAGDRVLE